MYHYLYILSSWTDDSQQGWSYIKLLSKNTSIVIYLSFKLSPLANCEGYRIYKIFIKKIPVVTLRAQTDLNHGIARAHYQTITKTNKKGGILSLCIRSQPTWEHHEVSVCSCPLSRHAENCLQIAERWLEIKPTTERMSGGESGW